MLQDLTQLERPWTGVTLPGKLGVPTMLTKQEVNYLYWLGRDVASGAGRIVELGCFLGGSTNALAAGLREGGRVETPMIVYDSFETDGFTATFGDHPYEVGESFRPLFEVHTSRFADRIAAREMLLPSDIQRCDASAVYPEAEPIELLFVDAAKSRGIHACVMHVFGRQLIPGTSLVVQQDFKFPASWWLAVDMWVLRDVFEPVHDVEGSCTLTFRCTRALTDDDLERLTRTPWGDAAAMERVWEDVVSYLRAAAGEHAGCAALAQAASCFERCGRAKRASAWRSRAVEAISAASPSVRAALAPYVDGVCGGAESGESQSLRSSLIKHALMRCHEAGMRRIALYGAGHHTKALLKQEWPEGAPELVVILDDQPDCPAIEGVPVRDASLFDEVIDGIVVSSSGYESTLALAAERVAGPRGIPVVTLYDVQGRIAPVGDEGGVGTKWARVISRANAGLRQRFNLPERTPIEILHDRERFTFAKWMVGTISAYDSAFTYEMVLGVKPELVVEVGVAAGGSSAVLLHGLADSGAALRREDGLGALQSFDVIDYCYFDRERAIGSGTHELCPDLVRGRDLHPKGGAKRAAEILPTASVDLAFIDGNHMHPWPATDVVRLLPLLRPGAWLVLHDINLPAVARRHEARTGESVDWHVHGAEMLFERWPGERLISEMELRNIGAVRVPEDRTELVGVLRSLLATPAEDASSYAVEELAACRALLEAVPLGR
jgi:predicted O-methyltransferase YrrM